MQSSLSLQDLEQFLSSAADASTRFVAEKSSVVFVMPEREEEVRMALTWLYRRAGRGGDVPLSYFPLPNLLHAMAKSLLPEASLATYCPNVFQAAFVLDQTIKFFAPLFQALTIVEMPLHSPMSISLFATETGAMDIVCMIS